MNFNQSTDFKRSLRSVVLSFSQFCALNMLMPSATTKISMMKKSQIPFIAKNGINLPYSFSLI